MSAKAENLWHSKSLYLPGYSCDLICTKHLLIEIKLDLDYNSQRKCPFK